MRGSSSCEAGVISRHIAPSGRDGSNAAVKLAPPLVTVRVNAQRWPGSARPSMVASAASTCGGACARAGVTTRSAASVTTAVRIIWFLPKSRPPS